MASHVHIYPRIGGEKLERVIARTAEAQAGLKKKAEYRAARAVLILSMHRAQGHSFIELKKGDIDYWLILNDTRGQKAAMTIEFGRKGGGRDSAGRLIAPSEPVAALRRATGLL